MDQNNPPSRIRRFMHWTGGVFGSVAMQSVSILFAGASLNIAERQRQDVVLMREVEREISRRHADYSECMADLQDFVNQHGEEEAPKRFVAAMSSTTPRSQEIKRVNTCWSITKEWWRSVINFKEQYPTAMDGNTKTLFAERYKRFVPLVQKFDGLPNYHAKDPVFEQKF